MTWPQRLEPFGEADTLAAEDRQMAEMRRRWYDWAIVRMGKTFHARRKHPVTAVEAPSLDDLEAQMREAAGRPRRGDI